MKLLVTVVLCALFAPLLIAQSMPHAPVGVVSDWTSHHLLFPDSHDISVMERMRRDPRWRHSWYLRHRELWWPEPAVHRHNRSHRDWAVPLGTATFGPIFDFSFDISPETGYGSVTTTDQSNNEFLATTGSLTVTAGADVGTYSLYPGGPGVTLSPLGSFDYDNLIYFQSNPPLDEDALLFTTAGLEINIWGNSPGNYSFYDSPSAGDYPTQLNENGSFNLQMDPGGGETYPSKYVFDVTQAPSCASDYVVLGLPATPISGGQANIIGVNNLYNGGHGALCSTGPTVIFAYASGTGEVPASVSISQNGTQLAYIENLTTGSCYFHVLTIGTTGNNGTSASAAAIPGNGNNAVDQTVLLSPDGGVTNQSSTNTVWVAYTPGDANDFAFATTYSSGTGSGYLYKISNVFNGGSPAIVWSVPINGMPSTPVYDTVSNKVFFTDSNGRIDYVVNTSTEPSVVYGSVVADGATSETAVVVDSGNQMVYATFNSNGTNALVVQAPTTLASSVSVPIGTASTVYASPFEPDFNNAFYTGSGTPLLYIAGTGTGTLPTLYSIGFAANGVLNSTANSTTAALATGMADSSPVTEFYNATLGKDYLFVGVANNCVATEEGGTGGCVMSLDITNGFPTVNSTTTALAAAGGTSGIVVDNDSSATQASSVYYSTNTGATLVKATQSALQ